MGKEGGDLWDDSALINAFDDAISKYKKMHGKGGHDNSFDGGKATTSTEEKTSALVDESHEAKRHIEADDNSNVASNTTIETREASSLSTIKENHFVDSCAYGSQVGLSNGQHTQNVVTGYSNTQGAEGYNQLLNKYYELEEQRQKILQQLQEFGNWNTEGSGVQWGTSTSQEHQASAAQAAYPTAVCSCCPYACQLMMAPCNSLPVCSLGGYCVDRACDATSASRNGKSFSPEDGDFVKTAMGAAERALSSLKDKASSNSDVIANEEKEEVEANVGHFAQTASTETDFTVVLNAWYSAGLYTGKYLSEQSFAKKRHS